MEVNLILRQAGFLNTLFELSVSELLAFLKKCNHVLEYTNQSKKTHTQVDARLVRQSGLEEET